VPATQMPWQFSHEKILYIPILLSNNILVQLGHFIIFAF